MTAVLLYGSVSSCLATEGYEWLRDQVLREERLDNKPEPPRNWRNQ